MPMRTYRKAMSQQNNQIEVYQFRIWLKGISPMIWRRLLVKNNSSIADLHYYLQIIMGWEDIYLNRFIIRLKDYGVYHSGVMMVWTPMISRLDSSTVLWSESFNELNFKILILITSPYHMSNYKIIGRDLAKRKFLKLLP